MATSVRICRRHVCVIFNHVLKTARLACGRAGRCAPQRALVAHNTAIALAVCHALAAKLVLMFLKSVLAMANFALSTAFRRLRHGIRAVIRAADRGDSKIVAAQLVYKVRTAASCADTCGRFAHVTSSCALQMAFRNLGRHGVRARKRAAVAQKHARVPVLHHATAALRVRTSVRRARATSVRAQRIAV